MQRGPFKMRTLAALAVLMFAARLVRADVTAPATERVSTAPLSELSASYALASFAWRGHLYALGGIGHPGNDEALVHRPLDEVRMATIASDGTVGPWRALPPLPRGVADATFFVARGFVRGIGWNVSIAAPIAKDGTIGAWFTTERAPSPGAVAVWGNHVYIAGGWAGVWSQRDDVWVAELRDDGTLGPWRGAGTLARGRRKAASVAAQGTLFVIGGERGGKVCRPDGASRNEDIDFLDDVEAAPIRADGTLGRFRVVGRLSEARSDLGAAVVDNQLFVLGGYGRTTSSVVDFAPIRADGGLGGWRATRLPARNAFGLAVGDDGRLFVVGGSGGAWPDDQMRQVFRNDVVTLDARDLASPDLGLADE
ncbi:MAG: hypothetical protein JWM53_5416 [bacterium]|nr:hypothetical protein [bacterium]